MDSRHKSVWVTKLIHLTRFMSQDPTIFEAWSGPICLSHLNCTIFAAALKFCFKTCVAMKFVDDDDDDDLISCFSRKSI